MRDILDIISLAALVAFFASLHFIFSGEPSLYHQWHERAVASASCK
jgi:hypothetical protein